VCVLWRGGRRLTDSDPQHSSVGVVRTRTEFILIDVVPVCRLSCLCNKLCGRPPQYAPAPCKLTFDLLTLKVVSESRVTWATSMPILVFLGLSVLDLGPMYATDRRQTRIIASCPLP